jgi:hypothetical protein
VRALERPHEHARCFHPSIGSRDFLKEVDILMEKQRFLAYCIEREIGVARWKILVPIQFNHKSGWRIAIIKIEL